MQPQLPAEDALQPIAPLTDPLSDTWFEYPVRVFPHQTDYSGIVWHGTYVTWLEEARIECLRSLGIEFADLVALGCDLPVVDLSIRYRQSLKFGSEALIRTRMSPLEGVRIHWQYEIQSPDRQTLYATAQVTLVAVDRENGKIMRRLPAAVHDALMRLSAWGSHG